MGRRSPALKFLLISLLVLAVGVATHTIWLAALGGFLVKADGPAKADIAVVLAGDYSGNRIICGAELVKQGYVPRVLVSGPVGFYGLNECDLEIAFAVKNGYPKEWFVPYPHHVLSTGEEARSLLAGLRRMHVRRFLLVTSNYHTRRAGSVFRSLGPDFDIRVVAAPDINYTPDGWWYNREGQKTFFFEWCKTLATVIGL